MCGLDHFLAGCLPFIALRARATVQRPTPCLQPVRSASTSRASHRDVLLLIVLAASTLASAQSPSLPISIATQVAGGGAHTCALTTAGAVLCWGSNSNGQLGYSMSTLESLVPLPVSSLASGVVAIAAGGYHTCALTTAGGAQCWGYNNSGQLGNNSRIDSYAPVAVSTLASGVVAIATGWHHSCALTIAGAVLCWGYNDTGELGNNSTTDSPVPVAVSNLSSGVAAIAAGGEHTCVLTTAGAVLCWGSNIKGQLGNNSIVDSHVPMPVSTLTSGVAAIAAGFQHTCALTTVGAVQCWGYNGYGQLGNNSTVDSHAPIAVNGLGSGAAALSAGQGHTCALTTAGGAQCWGSNIVGQLGDNSTTESHVPAAVSGLGSGVASISAGGFHTCALTAGAGAQCWGSNIAGQLGNDSSTDSHVPTAVIGLGSDSIFSNGFDN